MGPAYNPAFDGLRAFAIGLVLMAHSGYPALRGGARGVDVFFVLSGFLITSILKSELEAGRLDLRAFWLRRARRLMPALLTMLAVYVAFAPILLPQYAPMRWIHAALAAVHLNNYGTLFMGVKNPLAPTWSLGVEAQFYLLWPFVLIWLVRRPRPVTTLMALWVTLTAGRLVYYGLTGDWRGAYLPLHAHATGMVLGAIVAFASWRPKLGWLGLAILAATIATERSWGEAVLYGVTATEIATALILLHLMQPSKLTEGFSAEPLRRIGLISYGIYLWHEPVRAALERAPAFYTLGGVWIISAALATLSYVTVERWARGIRIESREPRPVAATS